VPGPGPAGDNRYLPPPDGARVPARNPRPRPGVCIWLTGLPSAGKTTLAQLLADRLAERGIPVELLDGDEVRRGLSADLGFDRGSRESHARRVAFVAKLLVRQGVVAIVALISPYRSSRAAARAEIGPFVEVHVATPLEVCEQRDRKGLYARARRGEIPDLTGVGDPYELPEQPEIVLPTLGETPRQTVDRLVAELDRLQVLPSGQTEGI
jgi:adenylylsulfate kinase